MPTVFTYQVSVSSNYFPTDLPFRVCGSTSAGIDSSMGPAGFVALTRDIRIGGAVRVVRRDMRVEPRLARSGRTTVVEQFGSVEIEEKILLASVSTR